MRRAHPLLLVLLLGVGACGGAGVQTRTPPPLSLPAPPGPEGSTAERAGGIAAKLTPEATPAYLRAVGEATRKLATGQVRMVAEAHGGKRDPKAVTELSVLEGRWDN